MTMLLFCRFHSYLAYFPSTSTFFFGLSQKKLQVSRLVFQKFPDNEFPKLTHFLSLCKVGYFQYTGREVCISRLCVCYKDTFTQLQRGVSLCSSVAIQQRQFRGYCNFFLSGLFHKQAASVASPAVEAPFSLLAHVQSMALMAIFSTLLPPLAQHGLRNTHFTR